MVDDQQAGRFETWAFRFFLGGVFAITFSIAAGETCLLLAFMALCVHQWRKREWLRVPYGGWLLAFVAIAVVTASYGVLPLKGIYRLKKLFWIAMMLPLTAAVVNRPGRLLTTLKAFALGGGVLFLDVGIRKPIWVWQKTQPGHRYDGWSYREALTDNGSMTDGEMLMVGVIVTLGVYLVASLLGRRKAWRWAVLGFLQAVAVFLNFKRGAWMCTGLLVAVLVALQCRRRVLLGLFVGMALVAWTPWAQERLGEIADQVNPKTGARWAMWTKVAPGMLKEYPWGVGYGSVNNRLMRKYWRFVEPDRTHLHNNLVQVAVETGWLGLTVYVGWMLHVLAAAGLWLRRLWRGPPEGRLLGLTVVLALLAVLIHGLVEYNFGDTELLIVFSALMAMVGLRTTNA